MYRSLACCLTRRRENLVFRCVGSFWSIMCVVYGSWACHMLVFYCMSWWLHCRFYSYFNFLIHFINACYMHAYSFFLVIVFQVKIYRWRGSLERPKGSNIHCPSRRILFHVILFFFLWICKSLIPSVLSLFLCLSVVSFRIVEMMFSWKKKKSLMLWTKIVFFIKMMF